MNTHRSRFSGLVVPATGLALALVALLLGLSARPAGATMDADITIIKSADPEDDTEFDFTGDLGDFTLTDPSDNSQNFFASPGEINVYESVPDGWNLVDINCTGADSTHILDGNDLIGVTISAESSSEISCTFYNEQESAEITINKEADPEDNTEFEFTGDLGNFSLFDPSDNSEVFEVTPGEYDVNEVIPQGWVLNHVDCTGGDPGLIYDDDTLVGVTFTAEDGDEFSCTFYNEQLSADLTIFKDADPEDDTEFDFTGDLGDFSLSVPSDISETFTELLPGFYYVYETVPDGWELVDVQCDSAEVEFLYDGQTIIGAIITLEDEDAASCTFYNEQQTADLTIFKDADPEDDTEFEFSSDLGNFVLSVPSDISETFNVLLPGFYYVYESVPDGWELVDVQCSGAEVEFLYDGQTLTGAIITLEDEDAASCTFYNEKDATAEITIIKNASPEDDTEFAFGGDLGGFTLKDPSDNSRTFTVPPGTYEITELSPFGWVLNTVNCDTEGREDVYDEGENFIGVELTVGEDDDVTCTFNNFRGDSNLTIVKEATPADDTEFDFYGSPPGFTLKDPSDNTHVIPLFPGTYSVLEDTPAGWTLVDVDCEGGDYEPIIESGTLLGVQVTVPVEGQVTCTFYNETTEPPAACPVGPGEAGYELTTIIGAGMGSTASAQKQKKIVIPDAADVLSLYGQLAAKQIGTVKYVRFIYPDKSYEQVQPATSLGQHAAISWWGAELDPEEIQAKPFIKGKWFLAAGPANKKLPRAFVLYPTYATEDPYANAFEVFSGTANHVAPGPGFVTTQTFTLEIPVTQGVTDVSGQLALVDNDQDNRGYEVKLTAGTSSVTLTPAPNANTNGKLLDILSFTLQDVPPGTTAITIELTVETLPVGQQDSVALIGATAHYACEIPT